MRTYLFRLSFLSCRNCSISNLPPLIILKRTPNVNRVVHVGHQDPFMRFILYISWWKQKTTRISEFVPTHKSMNHVIKISWFFLLACICSIKICHDLLPILCWYLIFCMSFRIERLHYLLVTTAADSQFCKELPNSSFLFAGSSCLEMRTCLLRILPPCVEIASFQIVLVSLWTCRTPDTNRVILADRQELFLRFILHICWRKQKKDVQSSFRYICPWIT